MSDAASPLAAFADTAVLDPAEPQEPMDPGAEPGGEPDGAQPVEGTEPQAAPNEPDTGSAPAPTEDQIAKDAAKHLREMRSNAETKALGDALTGSYHRDRQYHSLVGSIEDAKSLRYAVEAAGGVDGLREITDLADNVREMDRAFEEGDPQLIENWSAESPDGFKKLVPVALDRYAQIAPREFGQMVARHAGQFIQSSFIPAYMNELSEILSAADSARGLPPSEASAALRAFNRVVGFMNDTLAGNADARVQPGAAAAATPGAAPAATPQAADFDRSVAPQVDRHVWSEVDKAIKSLDTSRLSQQAVADLRRGIAAEISRMGEGDKSFSDTAQAIKRRGGQDRYVRFINGFVTDNIGSAARSVWNTRYGTAPARRAAAAAATAAPSASARTPQPTTGASRMLARQPGTDQLDMERPDAVGNFIRGRGHLKNGQPVHWKK